MEGFNLTHYPVSFTLASGARALLLPPPFGGACGDALLFGLAKPAPSFHGAVTDSDLRGAPGWEGPNIIFVLDISSHVWRHLLFAVALFAVALLAVAFLVGRFATALFILPASGRTNRMQCVISGSARYLPSQ